jgi:hypothetical protein
MTLKPSRRPTPTSGGSIASSGEIPARGTATPEASGSESTRISAVSSSALLMSFARELWSGRIPTRVAPTLPGLGGECDPHWSELDTLCCPSDSDPAALGLTTDATGCSCSVSVPTPTASQTPCKDVARLLERRAKYAAKYGNNGFGLTLAQWLAVKLYPTPTATDWKGSTGKGSRRGTLAESAATSAGPNDGKTVYPHPEFVEAVMRFPISWTELPHSETPSIPSLQSGSGEG